MGGSQPATRLGPRRREAAAGRRRGDPPEADGVMAMFMDIELVSILASEVPDAYTVTFDVIYPGETWCRSIVGVDHLVAGGLGCDEHVIVQAARDALLVSLAIEVQPVSFELRLTAGGTVVLARGTPSG